MESAPLNLAHFHERRADTYLKRNRYDEGIKAMETALAYIEDAYKIIKIPKAIEVLDAQKWNCSRKLKQISIRQSQYEGYRSQSAAVQPTEQHNLEMQQGTDASIHQAIENFDAKYASTTLESLYGIKKDAAGSSDNTANDGNKNWIEDFECKDFPYLAPLELPSFDLGFDTSSECEEQNK